MLASPIHLLNNFFEVCDLNAAALFGDTVTRSSRYRRFAGATHKRKTTAKVNLEKVEIRYWISVLSPHWYEAVPQCKQNRIKVARIASTILYRSSIEIESIMYVRARFLEPLLPRVTAVAHKPISPKAFVVVEVRMKRCSSTRYSINLSFDRRIFDFHVKASSVQV